MKYKLSLLVLFACVAFASVAYHLTARSVVETAKLPTDATNAKTVATVPILRIDRSQPFNPATFFGEGWSIWKGPADGDGLQGEEQQDFRSLALQEVDFSQVLLETYLKEGKEWITGEEKLRRMKESGVIRLDAHVAQAPWGEEGHKTLEWLRKEKGVIYIDFMGTELRSPNGVRCVLCLYWYGNWRDLHFRVLRDDWGAAHSSAALAKPALPAGR
jgi:hypothetical protein